MIRCASSDDGAVAWLHRAVAVISFLMGWGMRRLLALILALVMATAAVPVQQAEAANKRTYVYLSDDGIQIFGFELGLSGTLTELGDSPFSTGVGTDYGC